MNLRVRRHKVYRFEDGVRVKDGKPVRVLMGSKQVDFEKEVREDYGLFRRISRMGKYLIEGVDIEGEVLKFAEEWGHLGTGSAIDVPADFVWGGSREGRVYSALLERGGIKALVRAPGSMDGVGSGDRDTPRALPEAEWYALETLEDWERLAFIACSVVHMMEEKSLDEIKRWMKALKNRPWMGDIQGSLTSIVRRERGETREFLYDIVNQGLSGVRYRLQVQHESSEVSVEPKVSVVSLAGLLMYQLGVEATGRRFTQQCRECERWFVVGGTGERRRGAMFCSDSCRSKYHNRTNPVMSNRKRKNSGGWRKE